MMKKEEGAVRLNGPESTSMNLEHDMGALVFGKIHGHVRQLEELIKGKDARIAELEARLARYESQDQPKPGILVSSTSAHAPKTEAGPNPTQSASGDGRPASSGSCEVLEGTRCNPMEICESDDEDTDRRAVVGPYVSRAVERTHSNKTDLGVIELSSESESDSAVIADVVSTRPAKRRKIRSNQQSTEIEVKDEAHLKKEESATVLGARLKGKRVRNYQHETKGTMKTLQVQPLADPSLRAKREQDHDQLDNQVASKIPITAAAKFEGQCATEQEDRKVSGSEEKPLPNAIDKTAIRKLFNPKVETKKEYQLKDEDLLALLAPDAVAPYPISLPSEERSVTVTREQLSHRFGGNTMDTFPRPNAKNIAAHGRANFMCINLFWNPHGPQVPGHGGLFFEASMWPGDAWTVNPKHADVQTLFVRIAQKQWLYLGEYELRFSRSLTAEQWRDLHELVRATWVKEIHTRVWGKTMRARIHLRRRLAREPTRDEVEDAPGMFKNITEEDIGAALDSGDESIRAWSMKCIGYDEGFQRELIKLSRG